MAITSGDGSIILTTKIDQTGLKHDISSVTKKIGKAFTAIALASSTASIAITKMAASAYADYEQLIGGVETLFKGSAKRVMAYAENAFYTAGISANEYMKQVTSFSAALIRSTAGDTDKAADIANMALIDISDNVNKMGSSMESVTMAYQGFAKQQYMLLDNLKLGYGGTKTEMERLLKDAEELTGVEYDINNLADVYSAIHAIQEELGITGTTAKEAEKTITGSANMMKAAWKDALSAIAGGGDLDRAINNLVYSVQKYFENIVPVVERSLSGIATLISKIVPLFVQTLAKQIVQAIPQLMKAVYEMIMGIAKGIYEGVKSLILGTTQEIEQLPDTVEQTAKNQDKVTESVKETNKELKKNLASFDEIEILSEQTLENIEENQISANDNQKGLLSGNDNAKSDKVAEDARVTLKEIVDIAQKFMLALGVVLLMFGNISWGVALILGGITILGVNETKKDSSKLGNEIKTFFEENKEAIDATAIALFVLGIVLLFTGQVAIGLGMIAFSAGVLYIKYEKELDSQGFKSTLRAFFDANKKIIDNIKIAFFVLGFVLLFLPGTFKYGLGMLAVTVGFLYTESALTNTDFLGQVKAFFEENKNTIKKIAIAMFVVGVVLLFVPGTWKYGLSMIAGSVATMYAAKEFSSMDILKEINGFVQKYETEIKTAGAVLFVIGMMLVFVPGMLGFGLSLIIAGVGALFVAEASTDWSISGITSVFDSLKDPIADLLAVSGALLIVFGMLLCFTGPQGMPVGLAMIMAGAAAEYGAIEMSPDSDWVNFFTSGHLFDFFTESGDPQFSWQSYGKGAVSAGVSSSVIPSSNSQTSGTAVDFSTGTNVEGRTIVLQMDSEEFARFMEPVYERTENQFGLTVIG